MMQLSDEQQQAVRKWVAEGVGLSEIQRRLASEFDLSMTYMDARFLLIDLGLEIQDKPDASPEKKDGPSAPSPDVPLQDDGPGGDAVGGSVRVELDAIMQPGALVSGSVTFSDGRNCRWFLDQTGRLGLDADGDRGYRPAPEDVAQFQQKLQELLATRGF